MPACLQPSRVVEDDTVGTGASAGTVQRDIRVYFRTVAVCEGAVGPLRASAGSGAAVELAAVPVVVLGPPGASALAGTSPALWFVPALLHDGAQAGSFTIHEGASRPAGSIPVEWRVGHQARAVGWAAHAPTSP